MAMFLKPIAEGFISSLLFKIFEVLGSEVIDSNLKEKLAESIEYAIDKLSGDFPIPITINKMTFWDNFSEEFCQAVTENNLSFFELKNAFIKILSNYIEEQEKTDQIFNRFLALLEELIIKDTDLYRLLVLAYLKHQHNNIFNFQQIFNNLVVQLQNSNINLKDIEDETILYLITMQQWALKELSGGGIERCLEITTFSNQMEDFEVYLKIEKILESKGNYIILGEPGCGKTFSLKQILLLSTILSEAGENNIPIYIKLSGYGKSYNSIVEELHRTLLIYIPRLNIESIMGLLKQGSFILLLDGLDEVSDDVYEKCVEEIRSFEKHFGINKVIVSSRDNRYCNELGGAFTKCKLRPLNRQQIAEVLSTICNVPPYTIKEDLYHLFGNPLLLKIGIKVIQTNGGRIPLNRSLLFNEFVDYLIEEWEREKGLLRQHNLSYYETINLFKEIAINTFEDPDLSKEQMYFFITQNVPLKPADEVYKYLLNVGILDETPDKQIIFNHRTFKEYFAAKYIVAEIEGKNNLNVLDGIIGKKQWYEVFLFATGLFKKWQPQNQFLDYVLRNNLKLYIDCLKQKNDFRQELSKISDEEYAEVYLNLLVNSYELILDIYFPQIKHLFYPYYGFKLSVDDYQLSIQGEFSEDRRHLAYMFKMSPRGEDKVLIKNIRDEEDEYLKISHTVKRNVVNLRLSDLEGDSARQVAVKQVKSELEEILDKRRLKEPVYLISEKIAFSLKELRIGNKVKTLSDAIEWLDNQILKYKEFESDNLVSIQVGRVELFELRKMVEQLNSLGAEFSDFLLPGGDNPNPVAGWVWHFYTRQGLIERIRKYFKYLSLCFIQMVEENFSVIKNYMPDYINYPYKYIVEVTFSEDNPKDHSSSPTMTYYYVPTGPYETNDPEVSVADERGNVWSDEFIDELKIKYKGKESYINNLSIHSSCVSEVLTAYKLPSDLVLNGAVYDLVKNNLKSIGII